MEAANRCGARKPSRRGPAWPEEAVSMLKRILIGIAALLLLVVIVLVVVVATFDVDRYKPRIEQAAHDQLDRTLRFDGKLSLSLFPTIAVALPPHDVERARFGCALPESGPGARLAGRAASAVGTAGGRHRVAGRAARNDRTARRRNDQRGRPDRRAETQSEGRATPAAAFGQRDAACSNWAASSWSMRKWSIATSARTTR